MIFTILAPNYVHNSAGVGCLWRLANLLIELGHDVSVFNYQRGPMAAAPKWSRAKIAKDIDPNSMMIAPEVFPSFERYKDLKIVRWCLNKPGLLGGPTTYERNERVFHFSPEIEADARTAAHDGKSIQFMIGTLDLDSFQRPPVRRSFNAWYQGKYSGSIEPVPDFAIRITRHWPPTRRELGDILARTSHFYSFDDFSLMNLEAHLCGARVHVWHSVDGLEAWKKYQPPSYYQDLIINHNRDLAAVSNFVANFY